MLIYAGFRLAAPKEFIHVYKIGKEQLAIFVTTIAVTLLEDLLLGIAAGIIVKFLFHIYNGASLGNLFKARYEIIKYENKVDIRVKGIAVFSNLIGFKKMIEVINVLNHIGTHYDVKMSVQCFGNLVKLSNNKSIDR